MPRPTDLSHLHLVPEHIDVKYKGNDVTEGWKKEQRRDPTLSPLIDYLEGKRDGLTEEEKGEMEYRARFFFIQNGALFLKTYLRRNPFDARKPVTRLVVPATLRATVCELLHNSKTSAHVGSSRVIPMAAHRFYWPSQERYIKHFINTCPECQRAKASRDLKAGLLFSKDIPGVGHTVSMDFMGPLPMAQGYSYILTITDCFSRLVRFVPLRAETAKAAARAFWDYWVRNFGLPKRVLSDRGAQFQSELFSTLMEVLGIHKIGTSVYHAQTNTNSERKHGFLVPILKALTNGNPKRWPELLGFAEYAYNSTPSEGDGLAPMQLHLGVEPRLPVDLFLLSKFEVARVKAKGVEVPAQLKKMTEMVKKVRKAQAKRDKERYDKGRKEREYRIGQKVLAYRPPNLKGSRKLTNDMRGPYTITRKITPVTYELTDGRETWPNHVMNMREWLVREEKEMTLEEMDAELPKPERTPLLNTRKKRKQKERVNLSHTDHTDDDEKDVHDA